MHRNITSMLDQLRPGFPDLSPADTMIAVLPFYHIYGEPLFLQYFIRTWAYMVIHQGAILLLHFPFLCGAPLVIMSRFEPIQFCANIEKYKVTVAFIVPPILVVLARHPGILYAIC